jgi:L-alanine-DL-glutamate epimerase-like enolase superfamily enzyme
MRITEVEVIELRVPGWDAFWRDDLEHTARLICTAREHVGPSVRLMVDAATAEDGLPLMPLFKEHDVAWVEAPLPLDDWTAMPASRVSGC